MGSDSRRRGSEDRRALASLAEPPSAYLTGITGLIAAAAVRRIEERVHAGVAAVLPGTQALALPDEARASEAAAGVVTGATVARIHVGLHALVAATRQIRRTRTTSVHAGRAQGAGIVAGPAVLGIAGQAHALIATQGQVAGAAARAAQAGGRFGAGVVAGPAVGRIALQVHAPVSAARLTGRAVAELGWTAGVAGDVGHGTIALAAAQRCWEKHPEGDEPATKGPPVWVRMVHGHPLYRSA